MGTEEGAISAWVLADKPACAVVRGALLAWVTQVPVELAKSGLSVRDDHMDPLVP